VEPLIEETSLDRTGAPIDPMAIPEGGGKKVETRRKSPTQIALARLRKDRLAMTCLSIFVLFVAIAVFAPLLAKLEGQDPYTLHQDLLDEYGFPTFVASSDHWFGIEPKLGRDLFARWVYGARPSLIVACTVTVITGLVGVVMGLAAGFLGGWVDRIISWIIDFFLSLPYLLFAIAVPAVLLTVFVGDPTTAGTSDVTTARFVGLILVLAVFGWANLARLIRGEVLSLREREFVAAAKVLGVPTRKVLFKELLPNLVAPIIISTSVALPSYIVAEAGLTYLGVGLVEPTPSWGLTIANATTYYRADPIYLWLPVLAITVLVLSLSLLGDSIRDAFDPRTRR
jgi:ABC-type dipeptide/oligopeptide/nickel transport system permease subunit